MALADTANLIVTLSLKGDFARDIGKANRSLDSLVKGESRAYKAGAQIGTGIKNAGRIAAVGIAAVVSQVALGLDSLVELEQQQAQTNAVLKSTKGIAGVTATAVGQLADKYESLNATIGDEVIRSSENMLLTFTNVRKKAFEPTLRAILDMNTAMGRGEGGLQATTIAVGKALNDPVKGITALRKAGVSFTDAQVKKIKSLQKEGKLYEAQKIVLAELNKEFGGSFAKQGGTTAAKVAKFGDAIEDLQRTLAAGLLPVVSNVADALSKMLADPKVQADVERFGKDLAGVFSKENLATGAKALGDFFKNVGDVAPTVIAAAKAAGSLIGTAVKAFQSLPPWVQQVAVGAFAINKLTGGLVTNLGGGLIGAVLKQLRSAVVNVQGGVVNVSGAGVGAGGAAGGAGGGGKLGTLLAIPIAGAIIAAAVPIGEAFAAALPPELKGKGGLGMSESQTRITAALERAAAALEAAAPTHHTGAPTAVTQSRFTPGHDQRSFDRSYKAIERLRSEIAPDLGLLPTKLDLTRDAAKEAGVNTTSAVTAGAAATGALIGVGTATTMMSAFATQGAVRGSSQQNAATISAAIRAARPNIAVNVNISATTVKKTVTISERYGPSGGSADSNSRYGDQPI